MGKAKKAIFVLVTMLIMVCSSVVAMAASFTVNMAFNTCAVGDSAEVRYCRDSSATYQWYRTTTGSTSDISDWIEISGATGKTYTYSADDIGYYIGLIVSGGVGTTYEDYNVVKCSSSKISRTLSISLKYSDLYRFPGCILTATISPKTLSNQVGYKWYRYSGHSNNVSIIESKATLIAEGTDTYTTTDDDMGYYIYVVAEGTGDYDGISAYDYTKIVEPYLTVRIRKSDGEGDEDDDSWMIEGSDVCPGTVLTASTTAAGQEIDSVSYQWYVGRSSSISNATEIPGANTDTYTVQDSDDYKYIFVKATGTGDYADYKSGSDYVKISELESNDEIPLEAYLDCESTYVGNTATVELLSEYATVTYTWYRDDEVITGATDSTYTFTDDDIGSEISVLVISTDDYIIWDRLVVGTVKKYLGLSISANGLTLTAVTDPADATVTYQWQVRNSSNVYEDIEGANSSSYIGAYGNTYKVVATGTGEYIGTKNTATKSILSITLEETTSEQGTSKVGTELSLSFSYQGEELIYETDYTIDWGVSDNFDDDYELLGATGTSYIVTENEAGKFVHALFNGAGKFSGLYWDIIYYPDIELSSERSVGSTVMVSVSDEIPASYINNVSWTVFDDKSNYTTRVASESNTGLANNSYMLAEEDEGQHLQVIVHGKQASGTLRIIQSQRLADADTYITAASETEKKNFTASLEETSTEVGNTIKIVIDPEDATVAYTWYRDGEEITGATANTYTLTDDDVDAEITVKVVGTNDYEGEVTLTVGTITKEELIKKSESAIVLISCKSDRVDFSGLDELCEIDATEKKIKIYDISDDDYDSGIHYTEEDIKRMLEHGSSDWASL
jgi:hypothetical protein